MIKWFFTRTLLFVVFTALLALPFLPNKLIKYYPQKSVLSASSRGGQFPVEVENAGGLSKIIRITVFPHQFAYYERIFSLRNFSQKDVLYNVLAFVEGNTAKVYGSFNNGLDEILLHPGEKTYVGVKAFGLGDTMDQVRVFLEISTKKIQ